MDVRPTERRPSGIVLVDGNNLGWRGFGRTDLSFGGRRTELLYIGMRSILRWLGLMSPDRLLVVWDSGRDDRRLALFPEYKKKPEPETEEERAEKEEFYRQLGVFREMLDRLGVAQVSGVKREADDVIYTLVTNEDVRKALFRNIIL